MESGRGKEKVLGNRGHKIMKHFKILVWFNSPQVKWSMKSREENIAYELPHKLANDLRLFGKILKMGGGKA